MDFWQAVDYLREQASRQGDFGGCPVPIREARLFSAVLRGLPITVDPTDELAGSVPSDWNDAETRQQFTVWVKARDAARAASAGGSPDPWAPLRNHFHCYSGGGGSAHTTVDYERVITSGLSGIIQDIEAELDDADTEKRDYLTGMREALLGLAEFAERFADSAEAVAAKLSTGIDDNRLQSTPVDSDRLTSLAERCRQVPRHPARSFQEALQAIWLVHLGIAISEHSGASLSLGRLDQYLYPFFERDRADGIPAEELSDQLAAFFRKLNTFGDPACALNIGPAVAGDDDEDCFNPLSRLIIEMVKLLKLPSPILAARIHPDIPDKIFDLFLDPALFELGQPTFYGEMSCREALRRRGVPECELRNWSVNSCMGLMMPGQEWANMWGSVVNFLLPLEMTLNGGQPFLHEAPFELKTAVPEQYETFDELFETMCGCVTDLVDLLIGETAVRTERQGRTRPNPFVSALLDDCIVRGKDRLLGGCRYHTVTIEGFGLVNASDALLAVKKLVFDEQRFTLEELVAAAKADFAGHEDVLRAVKDIPKYGNGNSEADEMARHLAERFARAVSRYSTDAIAYGPSFHTLTAHLSAGAKTAASLDGRHAGDPLAKNVGTIPGQATEGHTALIRSAAAIDQAAFFTGQALDIWVDPRSLKTSDGRKKMQALLQTYFRLGGLQIQVNGVSPDTLRAAMAEPEKYQHVLVRKGGFTTRYVGMSKTEQEDMIERFEAGF